MKNLCQDISLFGNSFVNVLAVRGNKSHKMLIIFYRTASNIRALATFRYQVTGLWRRALRHRSQKDGTTWDRIKKLADDYLPRPKILHPWPSERFAVKHPREEPDARIGHVQICAGGRQQWHSLPR